MVSLIIAYAILFVDNGPLCTVKDIKGLKFTPQVVSKVNRNLFGLKKGCTLKALKAKPFRVMAILFVRVEIKMLRE